MACRLKPSHEVDRRSRYHNMLIGDGEPAALKDGFYILCCEAWERGGIYYTSIRVPVRVDPPHHRSDEERAHGISGLLLPGAVASAGNLFVSLDCISEKATLCSPPRTQATCASHGFGLLRVPLGLCPLLCLFKLTVPNLDDQGLLCVSQELLVLLCGCCGWLPLV